MIHCSKNEYLNVINESSSCTKLLLLFMCAQHGHVLIGESPQWGLIVPTISLRQGCPS